jgi:signal transduction histidine kinase
MREFIEALLFLSRKDRGGAIEGATCDVGPIVRQLTEDYRRLAEGKPIELCPLAIGSLVLDAPPALPTIVIGNLLRNAIEHTAAGKIEVVLDGHTLRIRDNGEGIAADAQARLFERDYTTKPGGGMGLHLTKRICDRFGWRLAIESAPGRGTTASVTFSAPAPEASAVA